MAVKASAHISLVDITDAYSVILTGEAYTFVGNTSGAPSGLTCTTQAVAYCGENQCTAVTIGTVTCPTGISATISNNGSSSPTITFKTTATVTAACEASIPVSVDNVTITKKFSFAVAKTGATGATGSTGKGVSSITEEYYLSTSKTTQTGGSWTTTPPTWSSGKYVWTRSKIVYTNPSSTVYTTPICDSSWEAVNEVEVGGRNLLLNSGVIYTATSETTSQRMLSLSLSDYAKNNIKIGDTLTISYIQYTPGERTNIGTSTGTANRFGCHWSIKWENSETGETTTSYPFTAHLALTNNNKDRISQNYTITPPNGYDTIVSFGDMSIQLTAVPAEEGVIWEFGYLKLEKGNKATDWSPAPEDMVAEEDVTGDYIISKINLTDTTATIAANRVNLTGYVTMSNLSTSGQTIINGSNITTGTISADRIDVTGIFAKNITATGTITGATINTTSGTIGGWKITTSSLENTNSSGNYVYFANGSNYYQDVLVVRTGAGTTASPHAFPVIIRANGEASFSNIKATGGTIGGWAITDTRINSSRTIYMGSKEAGIMLVNDSGTKCIRIQNANGASTFSADHTGTCYVCGNITLAGSINISDAILLRGGINENGTVIDQSNGRLILNAYADGTQVGSGVLQYGNSEIWGANHQVITLRGTGSNNETSIAYTHDSGNVTWAVGPGAGWHDFSIFGFYNSSRHTVAGILSDGKILATDCSGGTNRYVVCSSATSNRLTAYIATRTRDSDSAKFMTVHGLYDGSSYAQYNYMSTTSDVRLKTNITSTDVEALPIINSLPVRQFDWKESGAHWKIGFIADEIEEIDPLFTYGGGYDEEGNMDVKGVDTLYLLGYVVKGIQELSIQNQDLSTKNSLLEAKVESLQYQLQQVFNKLANLESQIGG